MDSLCDEILLQIFRHNKTDHKAIRQTCKRFNQLICYLRRYTDPLIISNAVMDDPKMYSSIINSKRIFNEIIVSTKIESLESYWKLKTICFQMGETIKKISWHSAKMTRTEYIAVLNLFPNLEDLECRNWETKTEFYDESSEILKLSSLKSLTIIKCCKATRAFFNDYLQPDILTKLEADFYDTSFILKQGSLQHFSLSEQELITEWIPAPLTHLSLNLRRYRNDDCSVLNSILTSQPDLINLNIFKCDGIFDGDDEAFLSLCNLRNLRALKINIDDLSNVAFKEHFCKLNNLDELLIESNEHNYTTLIDIIEQLSNIKLEYLKTFCIYLEHVGIPKDRIKNMGRNYPSLMKLDLKCDHPLPLDIYLKNFKMLTDLHINFHYSQEFSYICSNLDDQSFPNISQINLEGLNFGSDINFNETAFLKMIKALPNLVSLNIDINMPLNTRLFLSTLQKLPRLKVINSLTFSQESCNYEKFDADCINNFNLISKRLEKMSFELKLKAIDVDVGRLKEMLNEKLQFKMKKFGQFIIINLWN